MFAANSAPCDPSAAARQQLISLLRTPPRPPAPPMKPPTGPATRWTRSRSFPRPAGGYLGIYHSLINGTFQVRLATSSDLVSGPTRRRSTEREPADDRPAVRRKLPRGRGEGRDRWDLAPALRRLRRSQQLDAATPAATYDAPLTLSNSNEGTPDIRSVSLTGSLANSQIQHRLPLPRHTRSGATARRWGP